MTTGVPITWCDTCHREHPQDKRHCDNCVRPSAFTYAHTMAQWVVA